MKDQTTHWHKSSYSGAGGGNNECVEVAVTSETVGVRDTKDRAAGHLTLSPVAWTAFTRTAAH